MLFSVKRFLQRHGAASMSLVVSKMQTKSLVALIALTISSAPCAPSPQVNSRNCTEAEYQKGVLAYQKQQYQEAAKIFERLISEKQINAQTWLYLAHSQYASGHRNAAISSYQVIEKSFPGTAQAQVAAQCLLKIGALVSNSRTGVPTGQNNIVRLEDSLEVVTPQYGHSAVTAVNIKAIKDAIIHLPTTVSKNLRDNGTTFCISPTMEERFPKFLRQEREGFAGHTNATAGGLVDQNVIHVFQSKFDEATNRPLGARAADDLVGTFLHECGHALDANLGFYSRSDKLQRAFYQDIDEMPENINSKIKTFAQKNDFSQKEACAELTSVLLGGNRPNAEELKTYLGRTVKVLKAQLGLQ